MYEYCGGRVRAYMCTSTVPPISPSFGCYSPSVLVVLVSIQATNRCNRFNRQRSQKWQEKLWQKNKKVSFYLPTKTFRFLDLTQPPHKHTSHSQHLHTPYYISILNPDAKLKRKPKLSLLWLLALLSLLSLLSLLPVLLIAKK
jgi:hypothetical protein